MQTLLLTDAWQVIPVTKAKMIVQAHSGELFLGTAAPAVSSSGLSLTRNWPVYVDTALWTVVAVRGVGTCNVAD